MNLRLVCARVCARAQQPMWRDCGDWQTGVFEDCPDLSNQSFAHAYAHAPDELLAWVQTGYQRLKRRQAELLGIGEDGRQGSPLMRLITSKL